MAPAPRVAVKNPPLVVAFRDASQAREQDVVSFSRRPFGMTKLRSSHLDWRIFDRNSYNKIRINRP